MGVFDFINDWADDHSNIARKTPWWKAPGSNFIHEFRGPGSFIDKLGGSLSRAFTGSESPTPTMPYIPHGPDRGGRRGPRSPGAVDPRFSGGNTRIEDILAELDRLQDPGRYMTDPAQLQQQAMSSVAAQYDPLIAQLQQQQQATRGRAHRGKEELGQMFQALSRDLKGDIPEIQEEYEGFEEETGQRYKDLESTISGQYEKIQKDQEAMLKRLGIEAAAPDVFEDQMSDQAFIQSLGAKERATEESALGEQERGMIDYTRSGSQLARTEGTQRQADLMDQLREMMTAYDSQIGAHETAKAQAYQSALGELQQQMQQDSMQRAQQDFQNYVTQVRLGESLLGNEAERQQTPTVDSVESPGDIVPYLTDRYGMEPYGARRIQEVVGAAFNQPEFSRDPLGKQTRNPQERVKYLMDLGKQMNLSNEEMNALIDVAYQIR